MAKRNFGKEYKNPEELVSLLKSRGLIINDSQKAQHYLQSIGYYRLSAYMHPLLESPKSGSSVKCIDRKKFLYYDKNKAGIIYLCSDQTQ